MEKKDRESRIRRLVRGVNQQKRRQARQIDILCNDLIGAQRRFIQKLGTIGFAAYFYERIVGVCGLGELLSKSSKLLSEQTAGAKVAFFLRQVKGYELHLCASEGPIGMDGEQLENCFTDDLVETICKSNRICGLDDMVGMGLQMNPSTLGKISAVTVPLSRFGRSLGFMLICRETGGEFSDLELYNLSAVMPGLSRAIQTCQAMAQAAS